MIKKFGYLKGDKVIWVITFLLSLLSVLVVYSAVVTLAHKYKQGNTEYYLIKHFGLIASGFLLAWMFHNVKYTLFSKIAQIGFFLCIPLLLFTLLKGVSTGGATRWLEIPGTTLTFQSSDIAKIILMIYVARVITLKPEFLQTFKSLSIHLLLPIFVICALILPANFSTAALLFVNCLFIMFAGRVKLKFLSFIILICLAVTIFIGLLVWFAPDTLPRGRTWKARVENFFNGDTKSNYQSEQAKIAIAGGGVVGKGPGNSTQRAFLPQASSDFIYAIIIEEYGSITAIVILFLYLILFYRGIKTLRDTDKKFGGLVSVGLAFSLVFQALINMAVAVNLFPVTGQPLPLVSMGGTSIWFTMISIGIILSVSKSNSDKNTEAVAVN